MNKKLWILTITAFLSFMALAGCSADSQSSILSGESSSYINEDFLPD